MSAFGVAASNGVRASNRGMSADGMGRYLGAVSAWGRVVFALRGPNDNNGATVSDLFFARSQMALSLAFHIVFAVIGMAMPVLMVMAEARYLRTGDPLDLELCKRWARGTAVLFAVGAASGTVLSFELGLLWPAFMDLAGGIIGMPFSLEGFAFFTEAIFLGLYLYGWNRMTPRAHLAAGVIVALSGLASAVFVLTANAWMNAPAGFVLTDGRVTSIDPVAAMLNPASFQQIVHMTLAAYMAVGFGVAGVHAFFLLRNRAHAFHRRAMGLALVMAAVCAPLQILSGDRIAKMVARIQPAKFAAMEGHYRTSANAPLTLGGIADDSAMEVRGGIEIPGLLSILAHGRRDAEVIGLEEIPRADWPNTMLVHLAFDVMVACGLAMLGLALWVAIVRVRRREPGRLLLRALVAGAPLGFIAIEAGWMVTELGRQPWIIYGIMRTADAVTPMPGLVVPFTMITLLYVLLSVIVVLVLRRMFVATSPAPRPDSP
jgi:cytochrome d ubiquinol oxidase subunit I